MSLYIKTLWSRCDTQFITQIIELGGKTDQYKKNISGRETHTLISGLKSITEFKVITGYLMISSKTEPWNK